MANHTAAIHVLKSKLQLQDDDYRALLRTLTQKTSTKDMSDRERQQVRDHMQALAERMGVAKPMQRRATTFAQRKAAASPRERKVWALWMQLADAKLVEVRSMAAITVWVQRQTGVERLEWLNGHQEDLVIECLKQWLKRREEPSHEQQKA